MVVMADPEPTVVELNVDAALKEWIDTAEAALDRDGTVNWDDSRRLAEVVATKLWNELSAGLLPIPAGLVDEELDPETFRATVLASVKGEVGILEGTPIIGTTDTINSGPARQLAGEIIDPPLGPTRAPATPPRGPWKPAGEVGMITGAGTSLVEEPKNDAAPAIKQVGPG
jgi:hypothetical protein